MLSCYYYYYPVQYNIANAYLVTFENSSFCFHLFHILYMSLEEFSVDLSDVKHYYVSAV